jgi:diguanylate cyclase (GGDEF)-like protein
MPELIHAVARFTRHRDRHALDRALLETLRLCAPSRELSLYRCVGEPDDLRLLLSATARDDRPPMPGSRQWLPLDELPRIADRPVLASAGRLLQVFTLGPETAPHGLLECVTDRPLSNHEARLIDGLLDIYCNHVGLLDYGQTDALTGLLNRKTYDEEFNRDAKPDAADDQLAPQAAERRDSSAGLQRWLGVIDIDHFKRVNDRFGHLIGDELLLLVARLMRSSFRYSDALFRFGGEEFVVLVRAPDRHGAQQAFERFRERMAGHDFPQVGTVTASVGFTQLRPLDTAAAAFERADRAVYFAKDHGRNQSRCFDDLIDAGLLEAQERSGEIELF